MRGPTRLGLGIGNGGIAAFDLGNEPPLIVGDKQDEAPLRRAVSFRWLTGTILTGFTSMFLMGGALLAALNNPQQFATAETDAGIYESADGGEFGQKGDRIRPTQEPVASRQILQVSTVTKQGEQDFIKLRPFAKISATLTAHKDFASAVPNYDAMRIFADNSTPDAPSSSDDSGPGTATAAADTGDQIYGANVDGEVSVKMSDFPDDVADVATNVGLDTSEVEQIVRAAAQLPAGAVANAAGPLAYADPGEPGPDDAIGSDPFSALGVKIVPENVSNVAKTDTEVSPEGAVAEKLVAVAKGTSFRGLLQSNDVTGDDADQIVGSLAQLVDLNKLHVGQKVRLAFAADATDDSGKVRPIRVSIYDDGAHQATVARADDGSFVRADEPASDPVVVADAEDNAADPNPSGPPRVYDALYETALAQQVPPPLVDQLIRIFAYDVDFQSRVAPGDTLDVFHSMPDSADAESGDGEILYASLTLAGVTKRFYRFRTPDDGYVDYYDEDGKSAKKFLMRKPMTVGVLRSGFGWRVHPILGYRRLHTGVDFAAPRGTPILAAGNGIVEKAGPTSGYGNFTLVRHTNGYETGYGHQSAFAKGIVPGARVHQGQIIGYVGSTGLSTGPHLHFEIRVNGTPVDPLRIRLPRGRVLDGDLLANFEHERERIDALLASPGAAPAKVASAASAPVN